jgi:hypothetical protein
MLRYMVRIWDLWLEDSDGQGLPLPPILPVVLSHDERGWRSARRFGELFEADEVNLAVMRRFVPDFELVVDDIARVTDDELLARALPPATALSVWALRDGRSPEALLAHAPFWARVVAALDRVPGGAQAMLRIMEYLGEAAGERSIDLEQLAAKIAESAPDGKDVTMNSLERLLEKGRLQGAATARLETRHKTLLKQLRLRFGELREEDLATIEAADEATLERYLERFATADSVAAVLGG